MKNSCGFKTKFISLNDTYQNQHDLKTQILPIPFTGLFQPSHMQYDHERDTDAAGEPSLAEMTETSIEILQKNDNGFFLMVEGRYNQ